MIINTKDYKKIMKEKITALQKLIAKKNIKTLVLPYDDPYFKWLIHEELHGYILITPKSSTLLLSPLEKYETKNLEVKKLTKENFPKKALVNQNGFNLKHSKLFEYKPIELNLRQIKTKEEIKNIKQACKHTDNCFKQIVKKLKNKEFKSEKQIQKFIKKYAIEKELDLAFSPTIASGKNSSNEHHFPTDKLYKGFLVIDFGFKYKGYCSDMTRTLFLGKPNQNQLAQYNKVLRVQQEMIQKSKTGADGSNLFNQTKKQFGTDEKYFTHSLGHGLGIEVHEAPSLGLKKQILQKNMVITIEPGLYKKQGVRIEDVVVVGKKPEVLTNSTKKLIIIQ